MRLGRCYLFICFLIYVVPLVSSQSNLYPPNIHSINLTLVNISRDDNNFQLTCIAENIVGMTNSSIQLNVQCKWTPSELCLRAAGRSTASGKRLLALQVADFPTSLKYYRGGALKILT